MYSRWIFAVILGTFPAAAVSAQQSHLDMRRQIEQLAATFSERYNKQDAGALLASAEDRLPESTHFADCDVILSEGEKCPQRRLWAQARSSGGVTARGRRR